MNIARYTKAIIAVVVGIAATAAQHFLGPDAAEAVVNVGESVGGDATLISAISTAAAGFLVYFLPNKP
jgi:hypothetical protein